MVGVYIIDRVYTVDWQPLVYVVKSLPLWTWVVTNPGISGSGRCLVSITTSRDWFQLLRRAEPPSISCTCPKTLFLLLKYLQRNMSMRCTWMNIKYLYSTTNAILKKQNSNKKLLFSAEKICVFHPYYIIIMYSCWFNKFSGCHYNSIICCVISVAYLFSKWQNITLY